MTEAQDYTGLPVHQDYKRTGPSQLTDRVGKAELGHLLRALAVDPNVTSFGWQQYTPYFNDGNVCEFHVHDLWVQTTLDDPDKDLYELEMNEFHPTLGSNLYLYDKVPAENGYGFDYVNHRRVPNPTQFPDTARLAEELDKAIQGAEVTLLEWFGDHADIKVTKDGIEVDEYEHD